MEHFFGLAAGVIGAVGYIPYIRDILANKTKPDRPSWLIWSLEYAGLFGAQIAAGATSSLWLIGFQLACVLVIYGLSFRFGIGRLDKRTRPLLVAVCLALVAWFFTKNSTTAIIILLAVEASGVVLTAIKAYKHSDSETLSTWWLIGCGGLLGILAVGNGSAKSLYIYPISLIVMSLSVIAAAIAGQNTQSSVANITNSAYARSTFNNKGDGQ